MNILLDIHHHDLFRSLNILFYKRMGCNIYLPHGKDWNTLFKYSDYPNEAAIDQYLIHVKGWLNVGNDLGNVKLLTLDEYKDINIDIHVASLDRNIIPFKECAKNYGKKTKHIIQVGNNFDPTILVDCDNLLCSSNYVYEKSKIKNKVFYHQEFDLTAFDYTKCQNIRSVYSFQHYFATGMPPYEKDYNQFLKLKSLLPDFDFGCYGNEGERGSVPNIPIEVSKSIKNTGFVFHVKPQGDGYGHIYHNAFACGRPVIYKSEYLVSESIPMTPMFLFDNDTSIDLSQLSDSEAIDKIKEFSENYNEVSKKVYSKFNYVVNFDEEYLKILKFIENLI